MVRSLALGTIGMAKMMGELPMVRGPGDMSSARRPRRCAFEYGHCGQNGSGRRDSAIYLDTIFSIVA